MSQQYPGAIMSIGGSEGNSVSFNGNFYQYLSVAKNSALEPATNGAWTLETWLYATDGGGVRTVISYTNPTVSSGSDVGYYIKINVGTSISGGIYSGTTQYDIASAPSFAKVNAWTHVALVSTGSTMSLYVNGISVGTPISVTSISINGPSSALFKIGNYSDSQYFSGQVSNTRFVKGTAVYTDNFVPPTGLLQNISGTNLLTCQSSTIVDNSSNGFTITNNNAAVVSTSSPLTAYNPNNQNPALGSATPGLWTLSQAMQAVQDRSWAMYDPYYNNVVLNLHGNAGVGNTFITDASTNAIVSTVTGNPISNYKTPFAGTGSYPYGSAYFDGSSYLTTASNPVPATGNFTVEFWIYSNGANTHIFGYGASGGFLIQISSGYVLFGQYGVGTYTSSTLLPTNQWVHIAVVRNSSSWVMYQNGVSVATATWNPTLSGSYVTVAGGSGGGAGSLTGYISNLRLVNNATIYTGAFTPPTTPLTAVSGTQFLTLQTPNPATNNGFIDSSSNNFTITRYSSTTQGSITPYGSKFGARFSDRAYSYLPASSNYDITGGDWTIEFWIRINAINNMIYSGSTVATNFVSSVGWSVGFGNYGADMTDLSFGCYNGGWSTASNTSINSNSMPFKQWHHIAIVRNGSGSGNLTMYLNGVATGGTFNAPTYPGAGSDLYFGIYAQNYGYSGNPDFNISNFRVVKGTAVYTANFTPPRSPLQAIPNTTVLAFNNGIFRNNALSTMMTLGIVNNSPAVLPYTALYQNLAYETSRLGGSSYFDGSGDYLTAGNNAAYDFGTGDFTIEFWAYVTKSMTTSTVTTAIGYGTSLGSNGWAIDSGLANGCFTWAWLTSPYTSVTTGVLPQNSWCHVAIVRSGTTLTAYLNGVVSESKSFSSSVTPTNSPTLTIGQHSSVIAGREYQGYLADVRLLKGVAAYTGAFTPPTAPLAISGAASAASYPSTTNVNTSFASSACSLLLSATNAGVYDSATAYDFETVADAQISTTQSKYGGASLYFDGTGDYLTAAATPLNNLNIEDFTIEFWVYLTNLSGDVDPIGCGNSSNTGYQTRIKATTGYVQFLVVGGTTITTTIGVPATKWTHIAFVRTSGNMNIYINGVDASGTKPTGNSGTVTTEPLVIGANRYDYTNKLNGYIDDLRITKGVARYTGNFQPPTSQTQDQ